MNEMVNSLNRVIRGFKLDAVCVSAKQHRHFAFYDLTLGPKCRVSALHKLSNEIALQIKSKTSPIIKTMPEQGIVRLQVVRGEAEKIDFTTLRASVSEMPSGVLPFLLGETDDGQLFFNDMANNPHMLVAGSTGSGKSVLLHNLIANAVRCPKTVLMLADPKGVEFAPYTHPAMSDYIDRLVFNYDDTVELLEHLVYIMEMRYAVLAANKKQDFTQMYPFDMDKIVVIIDEVADLMLNDGKTKKFQNLLIKLAQKSRAAGIFIVLATQRPSVDILTGLIKANFEARVACRVSSRTDSQVILDQPGAENLLGRGDAILKNRDHNYVRFQVAFTDANEVIKYCSTAE